MSGAHLVSEQQPVPIPRLHDGTTSNASRACTTERPTHRVLAWQNCDPPTCPTTPILTMAVPSTTVVGGRRKATPGLLLKHAEETFCNIKSETNETLKNIVFETYMSIRCNGCNTMIYFLKHTNETFETKRLPHMKQKC